MVLINVYIYKPIESFLFDHYKARTIRVLR